MIKFPNDPQMVKFEMRWDGQCWVLYRSNPNPKYIEGSTDTFTKNSYNRPQETYYTTFEQLANAVVKFQIGHLGSSFQGSFVEFIEWVKELRSDIAHSVSVGQPILRGKRPRG